MKRKVISVKAACCLLLAASAVICLAGFAQAQQKPAGTPPPPCSSVEASQFDFWVGDWDLTWADSGKGTNHVTKPLGACVVQEQFQDLSANGLKGMSVSVYNPRRGEWEQTWVDNQGGYMTFTGGFADGKMTLSRSVTKPDGTTVLLRMVFHDITPNNFTWDWESSADNGTTWKTNWSIKYKRRS